MKPRTTDIAIIGGGIAGASLAAAIGDGARVMIVEGESHAGYHATGRSAAFWSESYGGPAVQPLTTASYRALSPYLADRGCLHLADRSGAAALDALAHDFAGRSPTLVPVDRDGLVTRLPELSAEFTHGLFEASCSDIDVGRYHADLLADAKRLGGDLLVDARLTGLARLPGGWRLETSVGVIDAAVVVDAAGAWASDVAVLAGAMPIPVRPYRRTVVQLAITPSLSRDAPLIMDARGRFYFKPETCGRIWLSPHDETPVDAHDVAPEELDVALAIDRFEQVGSWRVLRRERAWAGLRSFAPDRAPIYGYDNRAPGFFWFAGQGGFGIQTAPAAAAIAAASILGRPLPDSVAAIDVERYAPGRFTI